MTVVINSDPIKCSKCRNGTMVKSACMGASFEKCSHCRGRSTCFSMCWDCNPIYARGMAMAMLGLPHPWSRKAFRSFFWKELRRQVGS